MAFIGNTVQTQGFVPAIDYFNGNGSTTVFTLTRPVASVAQIIVAIDNVIQNPSVAYSVSGNSITFSSAPLTGTNNIWVQYTSLITQVIQPGQGTVNSLQLGTVATIPAPSGNTITVPALAGTMALTNQVIGIGQTWQDVTASRTAGTTYTNSTGKPIMVVGKLTSSSSAIAQVTVDGIIVPGSANCTITSQWMSASAIVPNGSTYIYGVNTGTPTLISAVELR